jgi:hypothetical protein
MIDIGINEVKNGPPGDRRYTYEPTYIRGLKELHITFAPNGKHAHAFGNYRIAMPVK